MKKKNDLTPDQKKRAITEFAAIEKRLDEVLFARNDDDDEDFPVVKTAGVLGIGAGAGLGINAIRKRGNALNTAPQGGFIMPGTSEPAPLGSRMQPIGNPGTARASTLLKDLKTGGKTVAGETKETVGEMFARLRGLFKGLGKTAARA